MNLSHLLHKSKGHFRPPPQLHRQRQGNSESWELGFVTAFLFIADKIVNKIHELYLATCPLFLSFSRVHITTFFHNLT